MLLSKNFESRYHLKQLPSISEPANDCCRLLLSNAPSMQGADLSGIVTTARSGNPKEECVP